MAVEVKARYSLAVNEQSMSLVQVRARRIIKSLPLNFTSKSIGSRKIRYFLKLVEKNVYFAILVPPKVWDGNAF